MLTLRTINTYFSAKKLQVGDRFKYSFSTLSLQEVKVVAARAGFQIRYIGGTVCEVISFTP